VSDGDTFTLLDGREQYKIRLYGIDCPESGQPFGNRAKQFTSEAAFGKQVTVEVVDVDRYGRVVGETFLPKARHLNAELVGAGLAWWYRSPMADPNTIWTHAVALVGAGTAWPGIFSEKDGVRRGIRLSAEDCGVHWPLLRCARRCLVRFGPRFFPFQLGQRRT
jgi:hypothetical protein